MKTFTQKIAMAGAIISLLAACSSLHAPQPSPAPVCEAPSVNHPKNAIYSAMLRNFAEKHRMPGAVMLVARGNFDEWKGAYGYAELDYRQPVTVCHQFRIASISKTFTAAVIMKLAEQNRLQLEQTVRQLLPEVAQKLSYADRITVRHLLSHTSGVYNLGDGNTRFIAHIINTPEKFTPYNPHWQMEQFVYREKPYFEPGKGYHYSNTNFILLGLIAEKVTGKSFPMLLEELILRPAGMAQTYLDESRKNGVLAIGYTDYLRQNMLQNSTKYDSYAYMTPSGGVVSTAEDLLRFGRFLFKGNFLSRQSLQQMQEWVQMPQCGADGNCEYGLGLEFWRYPAAHGIGHGGGLEGYNSTFLYFPTKDIFIIVLGNKGGGADRGFLNEIVKD